MSQTESSISTSPPSIPVITREELLDLVKAIQFAKPDVSHRQVHREITQELSKNDGYQFLTQVQLKDIQKVWKQATQQQTNPAAITKTNTDLLQKLQSQGQPPQLFTIGQNNAIQFLAQQYTASQLATTKEAMDEESIYRDYVHVFLDVPHDKSGSKPHQALIHFQKPAVKSEAKRGNNKKKTNKSNKDAGSLSLLDDQGRMIVKIQRAAPIDSSDTTQHPMLLYNQTRTHKTFIHPDEGYDRLLEWMTKEGQSGTLGATGGSKAYFYARVTTQKGQPDILSIDVTQLAPPQDW